MKRLSLLVTTIGMLAFAFPSLAMTGVENGIQYGGTKKIIQPGQSWTIGINDSSDWSYGQYPPNGTGCGTMFGSREGWTFKLFAWKGTTDGLGGRADPINWYPVSPEVLTWQQAKNLTITYNTIQLDNKTDDIVIRDLMFFGGDGNFNTNCAFFNYYENPNDVTDYIVFKKGVAGGGGTGGEVDTGTPFLILQNLFGVLYENISGPALYIIGGLFAVYVFFKYAFGKIIGLFRHHKKT